MYKKTHLFIVLLFVGILYPFTRNVQVSGSTDPSNTPFGLPDISLSSDELPLDLLDDPSTNQFNTYFGGEERDWGSSVALDMSGNIIISGNTLSADFPTLNAFDSTLNGTSDAYIAKFTTKGDLLWSSFLGGSDSEFQTRLVVDSQDNAYIAGVTLSSDFPLHSVFNDSFLGDYDFFLAKFNSSGSLIWSRIFGGSYYDHIYSLAIDLNDDLIITGQTVSPDFLLPPSNASSFLKFEAFLIKISSSGEILWSSLFGGTDHDAPSTVLTDSLNNIIVTGLTHSLDFPGFNSSVRSDTGDGFLVKFSSDGTFLWSTLIGNPFGYSINSLTIDSSDSIVLTGEFISYWASFSDYDISSFLLKFSSEGDSLWDLFFEREENAYAFSVSVDSSDNILMGGSTILDPEYGTVIYEVITLDKVTSNGDSLWELSFRGNRNDRVSSTIFDSNDDIIMVGVTTSTNLFVEGGFDSSHNGDWDVFLYRLSGDNPSINTATSSETTSSWLFFPSIGFFVLLVISLSFLKKKSFL
jgi:hypothetical protein